MDHATILSMLEDDRAWCNYANERRMALSSSPSQSEFRVFAILIVQTNTDSRYQLVEGANSEQVGGATAKCQ